MKTTSLLLVITVSVNCALAEEWNRFRGPNGSGISESAAPTSWKPGDEAWKIDLPGVGHSSPVITGDRLFITSGIENDGSRVVFALNRHTGKEIWRETFAGSKYRKHRLNSFASSTPALDNKRLYLCWAADGVLHTAAVTLDGQRVWEVELGEFKAGHGYGVSPIVFKDSVIVANEHEGQSVLYALDSTNGKVVWRTNRDTRTTYTTPCIYRVEGRKPELIFTNWKHGTTAVDPLSGKTTWEIDVFDKGHFETSIGSPIVAGGLVYATSGYLGYSTQTVAVKSDARNVGEKVFQVEKLAPLTTTPVVQGDLLFLWADDGIVSCVHSKTGELFWKKRVGGKYYGSPVIAKDALYCLSTEGEAVVLRTSREYEEIARNQLGDPSHSTPAIVDGTLYIRTFGSLFAVK
ncbi:MAG: hypothetical protein CMJ78_14190 [Planctomycetaceae bacterium]|nr:hypothetical protein [Planctomycetaceae bacterium]